MQALVGQALIEIRATWEGVAADTRAALAEVEGQIAATEARIGASVGGTVSEVEASSKAMAAAVKTATDEVGIAWVSASQAGSEFAVSQSEVRAGIRGATIDAQSLAASTDGLIAGFLGASQAGQVFTTTEAGMRAEMRAVAADADEAFATMFTGFATGSQQLESQIAAAIAAEKALGAGAVEAASEIQILDGTASTDATTVARLGTAMEGTAASVKRVTIASAEYADELVALIERDEALGMAVGQLMARYEGLDIKTAEHIVQNRGVAASSQAATDALAAEIVAVQGLTRETAARSRSLTALGTAIDLAAKQEQGLINVTAARARALGVASLTESEAAQVSNAYTAALERQFLATGRTANVSGAMKAALASMNPEVDKSASSSTKAAAAQMGFGDEVENAAVKFNFLTRTIRNSLFIVTGLEAATAAVTIKMAEEENKLLNLSQQFGIASDEISGFSLLSKATGESIDTINTSLRMMQKGFAGVGDGSNLAQQAFAALGIQTAKTGATARDTSTIFKQVADVMALIPDGEQKIAVGTAIMGRSFNAVIPLINQGSAGMARMTQASRELGTELTTFEMLTSHGIVTAWTDFKGALQGVGFAIERDLAPSILTAITTTTQWIAANRELVASNIAGFVRSVGSAFGSTVGFISDNIGVLKSLAYAIGVTTAAYKALSFQQGLAATGAVAASWGQATSSLELVGAAAGRASRALGIGGLATTLTSGLNPALLAAGIAIEAFALHQMRIAEQAYRDTQAIRDFQSALDRLTPSQRAALSTGMSLEAQWVANSAALKSAEEELQNVSGSEYQVAIRTKELKDKIGDLKVKVDESKAAWDRERESQDKAGQASSVLTAKAIQEETARLNLLDAFKKLQDGRGLDIKQIELVEKATGEEVESLQQEFKKKELSTNASKGFAQALGMEEKFVVKAVKIHEDLGIADEKTGRAAAQAAAQVDKFNASAAKATAQEMATQVTALANELSRLSLPEAIERLPVLLNLNAQALDAEVAAIRAETETKLSAAKTEEARNAALAEEADRIQKATAANELHAQKLVDTVTHTESAAKITEEYTKTIRGLQDAQDALKITVIDDQIKAITDSWKNLDIATRQSQLPQVLDLLAQKYDILAAKEKAESEAKIANARAAYDSAEAAYAQTNSAEDLASMVAALNALWGITDAVQANAALSAEDLAFKMNAEAQAARDAAAGTTDLAQAQQLAAGMASDLSKALVDVVSGTKDAAQNLGKQIIAQIFDKSLVSFATSAIQSIIQPALNGVLGGISFQQLGSQFGAAIASPFIAAFGSTAGEQFGPTLAELGTTQAAVDASMKVGATTGASIVQGLSSFLQNVTIVAAPIALAAGIGTSIAQAFNSDTEIGKLQGAVDSYLYASIVGIPVAMLDQITGGLVSKLLGSLFGLGPNMEERIAAWFSRSIGKSFKDPQVAAAVDAGAKSIGDAVGASLLRAMTNVPVKAIHDGLHDQVSSIFSGESAAVQTEIQQLAQAVGTSVSAEMGYVGSQAIAFSQQWANAWLRAQVDSGKSAQQIIKELRAMAEAFGTSGGLFAALDELNRKLLETGRSEEVFADLGAIIKDWTGAKKSEISTLSDVLAAFGGDTVLTLNAIKKAFEDAGIPIEQFTGDLGDVVLAFSGDAGTVIRDASKDMQDFGNYSDGTAQIIEQKVVAALGNVVKTAEQLGYTPESIEALGTAASLISPELLKSDAVVQALHDSFAQMAVGAHMSIRELIDSIDPPLEQSVRDAILAVDDLAAALGSLSDAPLSSLKEVTDRMKQFAGDMYREVKDSEGKVSKELTAFGEQLVKDAVSAIGGMWDTITADGVIDPSDIQAVFEQLAQIPEEVLGDSSVQSSIQSLLAMIGEQTGDAFIIGLSALPEVTKAQLDEALKIYDEWKKKVEDQPVQPEVQPTVEPATNPDGTPANKALDDATTATDGLATSTTGAKTATDDLTTSLQDLQAQAAGLAGAGGQTITDALGLTPEAAAAVTNITAEVLDSSGELTTFGETLNKQLQSGLSGLDQTIADEMSSAGQFSADTAAQIAYQLAEVLKLPPEQLSDSTKQAIDQLKADLMAALNLTSEQVDAMIAEAAKAPPPVPTGTTKALGDATTATDGLTTSTTGAKTATDDLTTSLQDLEAQAAGLAGAGGQTITDALGLTPEAAAAVTNITAGLSTAASGATDMAAAVTTSLQDLEAQAAGLAGAGGQTITDALGLTPEALGDATTATDGLATSTTGAKTATDDLTTSLQDLQAQAAGLAGAGGQTITDALGLTPEAAAAVTNITAGLSTAASGATEMATAVQAVTESVSGSTDEFAALAKAAGMSSEQVRAAIQPIIGAEDDGQSLVATQAALSSITTFLPEVVVPGFADFETDASLAVSGVFGKVGELQSALSALVTNGPYEVSVVTHYTADGEPPQATQQPPPMAVGGWIPGAIGSPYPITAHGQELVVPAATATTLPPSLVDALLSGTAFRMPADFAPRLSPVAASSAAPAQASPALPIPPGWALVPIREDALIDRALVRLEKDTKSGQAWLTDSGKFRVHPHLRARARRG